MRDISLEFCSGKSVASAFSSDALDFKQANPNIGTWNEKFVLEVIPTVAGTGTGTVTFSLEESENGTTFTKAATYAPIVGTSLKGPKIFALPLVHGRYLRLSAAVSGTVTGTITAYLTNDFHNMKVQEVEGFEVFPIGDDEAS